MITKTLKHGLTLAFVMAFLTACSSSSNTKNDQPQGGTDTGNGNGAVQVVEISNVVYFDFDKYDLTAESRAVLLAHADKLKGASVAVRWEGHADERGSREYNMALGEKRANAVRDFLVTQGVNGSSLETVSFGEEQPAVVGSDDASWAQNRRVEVKY
ncbi:MAG: peptidoglycan-associated lipoprotein Pal [Cellvibrio sp.]|nr:peptidoglycan-associated lipoprotein Pal [Cellvibrio sp.]